MATINITGTGGIIEGNLGAADVNVNLDSSLYFDGNVNNDRMVVTDDNTKATGDFGTAAFSVSFWVYMPSTGFTESDTWGSILGKGYTTSAPSGGWGFVRTSTNNSIYFQTGTDAGGAFSTSFGMSDTLPLGAWTHICITRNGTALILYVNGKQDNTNTATETSNLTNSGDFKIGTNNTNAQSANITVSDVKIFSDVLLQSEVQYLSSKVQADPDIGGLDNCESWWKINEGTGTNVVNHKKGSANGTITGAEWQYDKFSVDVYDGYDGSDATTRTTTDGTFTVTQGKVEGKALTSLAFDGGNDNVDCGSPSSLDDTFNGTASWGFWMRPDSDGENNFGRVVEKTQWEVYVDDESSGKTRITLNVNRGTAAGRWISGHIVEIDKWNHILWVYDGSSTSNDPVLYLNGVAQTLTESSTPNGSITSDASANLRIGNRAGLDRTFDGDIKDVRYYDYLLSAEQAASLYSNTYPQTPNHHWKFDDSIQGVDTLVAVDSGTETAANGALDSFVVDSGNAGGGGGSGWQNGTLDLDGDFTIAANGTLSAPRGTLELAGTNVKNLGAFTHNSGTVKFNITGNNIINNDDAANDTVFHNVISNTGGRCRIYNSLTIENSLTHTSGTALQLDGSRNITLTMGTATSAGSIDITAGEFFRIYPSASTNTVTAANSLFPCVVTGADWSWSDGAGTINLSGLDFQYNITTGTNGSDNGTLTLTGDCEFDAVTVSSGDTLDCGTHDITTSGTLTVEGTFTGGSGLHNINSINGNNSTGDITLTSGITFLNGGGSSAFSLASGLSNLSFAQGTLVFNQSDGNQRFEFNRAPGSNSKRMGRVVFNNGPNNAAYIGAVAWTSSTRVPTGDIIVASTDTSGDGFLTQNLNMSTDGNMTIATGGKLSAGSSTLTVAGDFTTSGGLLGVSCLSFTSDKLGNSGQQDYAQVDDHADLDFASSRNALTLECWFKVDHNDTVDYLFDRRDGQDVFYLHVDPSNVLKGRIYTNGTTSELTGTTVVNDGKWHHCALVYDGDYSASTTTAAHKLYVDGKLDAQELGSSGTVYSSASNIQFGARFQFNDAHFLDGEMDEIRMFAAAKTAAQIRADMFTAEGTALTHFNSLADASTDGLIGRWSCNEGTGSSLVSTGNTDVNATIKDYNGGSPQTLTGGAWAGSGTFTQGNSTLVMSGTGKKIFFLDNEELKHLTCSGTITLDGVGATGNDLKINGNISIAGSLASEENEKLFCQGGSITFTVGTAATSIANLKNLIIANPTTVTLPALTTKQIQMDSGGTVTAGGDLTLTTELLINSGGTVNANGKTITAKVVDMNGTGAFALGAGALVLNDNSGGFESQSDSTFTAGPGCTIGGDDSGQKVPFQSQNGFQIVGDIDDLNVTGEELTVIGTVTNCTGDILQFTPGHDTSLSLETDTAEDRDIRLGGPSLDNANHLVPE